MKPTMYKFAFWAWFGLVLLSSFFSSGWITKLNNSHGDIRSDYLLHFIVFFVFPVIGWYGIRDQATNNRLYLLMIAPLVLAVMSEFLQKLVLDRVFNPMDMLANILGIIVGTLLILLMKSTKDNLSSSR
jgi:VanZ family protein